MSNIGPIIPEALPIYDLYAVSHHQGSLIGGHYTAICQNPLNKCWYEFNDSSVTQTTPQAAVNPLAYVLFYRRRLVNDIIKVESSNSF